MSNPLPRPPVGPRRSPPADSAHAARFAARPKSTRAAWLAWGAALALTLLTACHYRPVGPAPSPADLKDPGWSITRGQAVWTPKTGATEVAGELTVARSLSGRAVAEFSKPPLPVVVAVSWFEGWAIEFAGGERTFSGKGDTRFQYSWLVLLEALQKRSAPPGWTWTGEPIGKWSLENPKTGERLQGYLAPAAPPVAAPATNPAAPARATRPPPAQP